MFRYKDRIQKEKRILKKKNNNKDKDPELVKDIDFYNVYGDLKIIELTLRQKYNIKVQKNDLRNLEFLDEDKIIGNSNVKDVRIAIDDIEKNRLEPYNGKFKHDITKWSTSKKKQKEKNRRKREKMDKHNFL